MVDDGAHRQYGRYRSLVEMLARGATDRPDGPAFTWLENGLTPAGTLTTTSLLQDAQALAAHIQSAVQSRDRVIVAIPNRLEFITAWFGCLLADVIPVPVAIPSNEQVFAQLAKIIKVSDASAVLTIGDTAKRLRAGLAPLGCNHLQWFSADNVDPFKATIWRPHWPDVDDVAFLQFTSGSTGSPKGVMVTHGNLLHNCYQLSLAMPEITELRLVSWLPFFHDWGLVGCIVFPLFMGGHNWFFEPAAFMYAPLRWLNAISQFRANVSCAPNSAYEVCTTVSDIPTSNGVNAPLDLSCWKVAMVGAEPVQPKTVEKFSARFERHGFNPAAIHPSYGLAEATLFATGGTRDTPPKPLHFARGTLEQRRVEEVPPATAKTRRLVGCGKVLSDQRVVIVDPETGVRCSDDHVGEIWISGKSVSPGYWQNREETSRAFESRLANEERPFLRTGDLGFFKDGELYICGRVKDIIIKAGQNFFAEDIEAVVKGLHPSLRDGYCAACSVDSDDGKERLVIVHEINYGPQPEPGNTIGQIQKALSAEHSVMADAIVLIRPGSLPRTTSGKVRRSQVRQQFQNQQLQEVHSWRSW